VLAAGYSDAARGARMSAAEMASVIVEAGLVLRQDIFFFIILYSCGCFVFHSAICFDSIIE